MIKTLIAGIVVCVGITGNAYASKVSDVFAAYTTDYPSITEYSARLHPNSAHLCVSFMVVKPTAVKIRWKVECEDGTIRYYAISTDQVAEDEVGDLQPGIYNKCFHPPELEPGKYNMTVSVKSRHGAKVKSDRCKFEISGF